MSIKGTIFYLLAKYNVAKDKKSSANFSKSQSQTLNNLISQNKQTTYGRLFHFDTIYNYATFKKSIPLNSYDSLLPFIEKIKKGQDNILTKEKIKYFLKTSGTTAGSKFIPLTLSGLKSQIQATNLLLSNYVVKSKKSNILNHKMIFIQGSPELDTQLPIPSGRLSGIVYHHIPQFFQKNKLPSYKTNTIPDWQEKIKKIVEETVNEDISVIGGIPPWCIQYFELLIEKSGKNTIKEIFPNLSLYIHGGVDFTSYRTRIGKLLGNGVDILETFPASEGFFGIQDNANSDDLQLLTNNGVFYEFIHFDQINTPEPKTLSIDGIKEGEKYELVVSTVSGLWRYRTGDLIKITQANPPRIKVVGRTSQFISAFGEHIILSEIEYALQKLSEKFSIDIQEFLVSPNVQNKHYEWRIEASSEIEDKEKMEVFLDEKLAEKNPYYKHLIDGNIINKCSIIQVPIGTFEKYRKSIGKSGGQFKIVRIENDRTIASAIDKS